MATRKSSKIVKDHHPRGGFAQEHTHGRIPGDDRERRPESDAGGLRAPQPRSRSTARLARPRTNRDWSDLVVQAPPLFIQEKVHPKALIDDLLRRSSQGNPAAEDQLDLFANFNGLPDDSARTEFYRHDANWSNRMILGDSLQVMASLSGTRRTARQGAVHLPRPALRHQDSTPTFSGPPPVREVKDGNAEHITREPEQVKAFRDTWRDGIHSYLTYIRDRLTVARDLLTSSGSIFVQIGEENVHRVRSLMDEVFGEQQHISLVGFAKTSGSTDDYLGPDNRLSFVVLPRQDERQVSSDIQTKAAR